MNGLSAARVYSPRSVTSRVPLFPVLVAFALLLAACTQGASAETSSTTTTTSAPPTTTTTTSAPPPTTTTTATTTTTTTTIPVANTINGLPAGSEELASRRVVAVKVDNHPRARPQFNLEHADAVYELLVEAGLTRFIALFHQSDIELLGPVRSGRPTDPTLVNTLGAPFQISGAQPWVVSRMLSADTYLVGDNGVTTWRNHDRPRPNNLMTSTSAIRAWADEKGWPDEPPPPLFVYGEPSTMDDTATRITFDWSAQPPVRWIWNGEKYLRFADSAHHLWVDDSATASIVTADALVVLKARRYIASGGSGSPVPALETVGEGDALAFYNGGVVGGTWQRGSEEELIRVTLADGSELVLPPGRVWVSVFPDTRTVSWE